MKKLVMMELTGFVSDCAAGRAAASLDDEKEPVEWTGKHKTTFVLQDYAQW
jgi:hypothetical protein